MKYLILILIIGLAVWIFKKPKPKLIFGFQKNFILLPEENIIYQWEIYIPPTEKPIEDKAFNFFEGGKVLSLIMTSHERLLLIAQNKDAYIFAPSFPPVFNETSKKAKLHLFARVATAKVLDVQLPEIHQLFEWHVPLEAVPVLMKWPGKTRNS